MKVYFLASATLLCFSLQANRPALTTIRNSFMPALQKSQLYKHVHEAISSKFYNIKEDINNNPVDNASASAVYNLPPVSDDRDIIQDVVRAAQDAKAPITINVIQAPHNKGKIACNSTRIVSQKTHTQAHNSFNKNDKPVSDTKKDSYDIKSLGYGALGGGAFVEVLNLVFSR